MTSAQLVILSTLIAYKLVLIGFGLLGQRRTHDETDFYLGGRRLGPLVAAISASASSSSAWTLVGVSGFAYAHGLAALWLFPACVGGFLLNWYVVAPGLRRTSARLGAITATEIVAGTGPGRRTAVWIASLIIVFSFALYVAAQFRASGEAFEEHFAIGFEKSVVIGGVIVLFYTLLGGFWAVSLTDTLQGLMMAAVSLLLPVVALVHVGGPGALVDGLRALDHPTLLDPLAGKAGIVAVGFVAGLLGIGLGYPGQPHVVNRFMALGDDAALRTARRIAIAWAVVIYTGMIVLGLAGRLIVPELDNGETVLYGITNTVFGPVLAGVVLAAVLSAIMSTADSQLLVASSSLSHDVGLGRRRPVAMSRLIVLALGAVSIGVALGSDGKIFGLVLFAWFAIGCAFGPLILLAALRGRLIPGTWATASIVAGFGLSVGLHMTPAEWGLRGTVFDRIVPLIVAGGIACVGAARDRSTRT